MATSALAAGAAGVLALPVVGVLVLLGSGAAEPPAAAPGTVCTVTAAGGHPAVAASPLTAEQVGNARTVVGAAKALGMTRHAAAVALMVARQESTLEDLANPSVPASEALPHQGDGDNYDSLGVFQQRPSMGWGSVAQLMDPGYAATRFLQALAAVPGWAQMPGWQAGQAVQHSADGTAYARWQDLGTAVAAALWDGTGGTLTCTLPAAAGSGPSGPLPPAPTAAAAAAIAYAQAQLGKPYIWGGTGPVGYDCSGLTMTAWAAGGVTLARTSNDQWFTSVLQFHDPAQLQPGDLVFYNWGEGGIVGPGHVALYVGASQVIQAPHTGAVVTYSPYNDGDPIVGYGRVS